MIILKENKPLIRFDFDDDIRYPPILYENFDDPRLYSDPFIDEKTLELPENVLWNKHFTNFHLVYDFDEQVYKKRKSYFHINDAPYMKIKAHATQWVTPVAFFAMDIKTCIDYLRIAKKNSPPKWTFIHHCVNIEPMDLFNPDSENDINMVGFSKEAKALLVKLFTSGYSHRYWWILERAQIMKPIYDYKGKIPFNGIALNFKNSLTRAEDRTEGLCLFQRSTSKMKVMRIAAINNLFDSNFDPRNYTYNNPESIVDNYKNGYYS